MMHTPCEPVEVEPHLLFESFYSGWGQASLGLPPRPPWYWPIPRQEAYLEGFAARQKAELLSNATKEETE